MKLNEFFDFCISKHKELGHDLEIAQSESKDYFDIHLSLSYLYDFSSIKENESMTVRFDIGCGKLLMDISYYDYVYKRKREQGSYLANSLRFRPKRGRHDIVEFFIEDLNTKKGRDKLKKELGMYFDDGKYVIEVDVMEDMYVTRSSYKSGITGLCYETREEAIIEARKLAEKLDKKYKRCHCVNVCEGTIHDEYGPIVGNREDAYIISSKSKSETIRAVRMSGYGNYNADEHIGKEPEIDKSNTIIVMSVFSGEEDEFNSPMELKRYNSLLAVETAIEKHIDEWLEKNAYTLNPEEAEYGYLSYVELEDDGEEIYACHDDSKTELRIIRKEFKL